MITEEDCGVKLFDTLVIQAVKALGHVVSGEPLS